MSFSVIDHGNENARSFESRAEADDKASGIKQMVSDPSAIEVVKGDYDDYEAYETDGTADTEDIEPEVIDHSPDGGQVPSAESQSIPSSVEPETTEAIDNLGESLEDDPLNILPGHMQDTIQGTPAINKRGYAMIAERYGIEVTTTIEAYPWDNDEGRCVAKAVAITEDDKEYTGHATACKEDGDMPEQIVELADTRAMKRAVSWASGLGIVAYEELNESL